MNINNFSGVAIFQIPNMNFQFSLNNVAVEVNGNIITPFLLIIVSVALGWFKSKT